MQILKQEKLTVRESKGGGIGGAEGLQPPPNIRRGWAQPRGGRQRLTFLANDKSSMIFTTFHSQSHTQTYVSGYVVKLQGGADTMDHCICHCHGSSPT